MNDLISRKAAYDTLTAYYHHKHLSQHIALKDALDKVPSIDPVKNGNQSELEEKILSAGRKGEEVRVYIGGRLFAIRELAQ